MAQDLMCVVHSALLTLIMLFTAAALRVRIWTWPGFVKAVGNRDDLQEPSPIAGRADRAAKNMLEGMVLFVAVLFAVRASGVDDARLSVGANVFFWARVAYFPAYLAGVKLLRTALWTAGIVGLVMIVAQAP